MLFKETPPSVILFNSFHVISPQVELFTALFGEQN